MTNGNVSVFLATLALRCYTVMTVFIAHLSRVTQPAEINCLTAL